MHTPTSPDYSAVIGKLANDDAFRAQVMADPVAAFGSMGIALDPSRVPAERTLPSKVTMKEDLATFGDKFDGRAAMILFLLAGNA